MKTWVLAAILLSLAVLPTSAACLDATKACAIPQRASNYTRMAQQSTCCCRTPGGGQCCGPCSVNQPQGCICWGTNAR